MSGGFDVFKPDTWGNAFSSNSSGAQQVSAPDLGQYQYGSIGPSTSGTVNTPFGKMSYAPTAAGQQYSQYQQSANNAMGQNFTGQTQQNEQGVANQYGGLNSFLQGQMNGTGPNLAQAQLNAATNQGIAAQYAQARSAPGSLASSAALRNAATAGVQAQQNANQQSAINTIQQQYNAAQQLQGALAGQGNIYGQIGQQQLSQGQLNQQGALAYQQLAQGVNQSQQQANEAYQQALAQSQGANTQNAQFNAGQSQNFFGGIVGAAGSLGSYADADLKEPGGPASFTLREEPAGPGHLGFILALDRQSGRMAKIATQPLSEQERRTAMAPHGAGPLAGPGRIHTVAHDMTLQEPDPSMSPATSDDMAMAQMGAQSNAPMSGNPFAMGAASAGQFSPLQQQKINAGLGGGDPGLMRNPDAAAGAFSQGLNWGRNNPLMARAPAPMLPQVQAADLDLSAVHHRQYGDANIGPQIGLNVPFVQQGSAPTPLHQAPDFAALNAASQAGLPTPHDLDYVEGVREKLKDNPRRAQELADSNPVDPSSLRGLPSPSAPRSQLGGNPFGAASTGAPARTEWQSTIDPANRSKLIAAQAAETSAAANVGAAETNLERQKAANEAATAKELGQQGTDVNIDAAKEAHDVRQLLDKRDQASRDVEKMGQDYGWHPTTGTRVRYAIASALGAFGASLAHTQNFALDTINKSIDRDLDQQQKRIDAAKGRVSDLDGLLAHTYRLTGDMNKAKDMARSISLQKVSAEGNAFAAASQSQLVKANNDMLQAQLQQHQAETLGNLTRRVTVGGSGSSNPAAEYRKYAEKWAAGDQKTNLMSAAEWMQATGGGGHAATASTATKPNQPSAALDAELDSIKKGAGQDFFDRIAPNFLRSTDKLTEETHLANAARAFIRANGGREPPAGLEGDLAAIHTAIGPRPDSEAVRAFVKSARQLSSKTANARQSNEPVEAEVP